MLETEKQYLEINYRRSELNDNYDVLEMILVDKDYLRETIDLINNSTLPDKIKTYAINRYYAAMDQLVFAHREVDTIGNENDA